MAPVYISIEGAQPSGPIFAEFATLQRAVQVLRNQLSDNPIDLLTGCRTAAQAIAAVTYGRARNARKRPEMIATPISVRPAIDPLATQSPAGPRFVCCPGLAATLNAADRASPHRPAECTGGALTDQLLRMPGVTGLPL